MAAYKIIKKQAKFSHKPFPTIIESQLIGYVFAAISGLIGIGGGTLFVPYLLRKNISPKLAVGISSVLGLVIGVGSSVSLLLAADNNNTNDMIGYIYVPAILFLTLPSLIFVKLSATWLLKIPDSAIKKSFACLLVAIGVLMLANQY